MFVTLGFALAAQAAVDSPLQKTVNRLVEQYKINKSKLGLIIAAPGGEPLASLNSESQMTPASTTKIVTAAAILEKMPIGQQFFTKLLSSSEPTTAGAIEGDLYLQGGGDPGFVSESMWVLVNDLTRADVKSIHGDIVVDDNFFDAIRFDPNRDQTRVDRAYDSPIGAMTFNWSAVSVFVRPGRKAGEPARVYVDPENDYIVLSNRAKTTSSGATHLEVTNETVKSAKKSEGHETIVVTGSIAVGADEFVAYKSIVQPEYWAAYQLRSFLKQRGITVSGTIKAGHAPAEAKVLATNKSKAVPELVTEMMKFSNNYIAEILTKDLGAIVKGPPGTMEKGMAVINEYLKDVGLNPEQFTLNSPSGLSRKNHFKPADILKVLEHVRKRFQTFPEYAVSLPIGGVDGTLRKRMKNGDFDGIVRAKTGHLDGVVGLGGYAGSDDGKMYEFLFLYNGEAEESDKAKKLFDSIVAELLKHQ